MRVYVAGPLSRSDDWPDMAMNVRRAIEAAGELADAGHTPFCPHLSHFWHMMFPRPYEDWLRMDFEWISVCHALLRMSGHSPGGDREVAEAKRLGLPVFFSVADFVAWAQDHASVA
jgi:hypothetical protein